MALQEVSAASSVPWQGLWWPHARNKPACRQFFLMGESQEPVSRRGSWPCRVGAYTAPAEGTGRAQPGKPGCFTATRVFAERSSSSWLSTSPQRERRVTRKSSGLSVLLGLTFGRGPHPAPPGTVVIWALPAQWGEACLCESQRQEWTGACSWAWVRWGPPSRSLPRGTFAPCFSLWGIGDPQTQEVRRSASGWFWEGPQAQALLSWRDTAGAAHLVPD